MVLRWVALVWVGGTLLAAGCSLDRDGGAPAETSSGTGAASSSGTGGTGGSAGSTTSGTGGTSSGTGGTTSSGTGGGTGCGSGTICAPDPGTGTLAVVPSGQSCPAEWANMTTLYDGIDPGCAPACTCSGAPTGSCALDVQRFDYSDCTSPKDSFTGLVDGQCVDVISSASQQAHGYQVGQPYATESCAAPTNPAPVPLTGLPLCALSSPSTTTCLGGVCVPTPPGQGPVCILLDGHVDCPPEYPAQRQDYASADDQRSCSCACTPNGSSCGQSDIVVWENGDCTGGSSNSLSPGVCWDLSGFTSHDSFEVHVGAYTPGSCIADSKPGQVNFSDPVTVCCQSSN